MAGATSDEEFFGRLAAAGLLIRKRTAPSGDLLGYKVALVGDVNAQGEPVFSPRCPPRPRPLAAPHPRTLVL
ncbi:hypothetical protein SMICM304S_00354 [Streptomyces microflavus]